MSMKALLEEVTQGFNEITLRYGTDETPPDTQAKAPELKLVKTDEPEEDTQATTELAAQLNDLLRNSDDDDLTWGFRFESDEIKALGPEIVSDIRRRVAEYSSWNTATNPDGLRDHGLIEHPEAGSVVWDIACYADETLEAEAQHPEDPEKSYRVLSIYRVSDLPDEAGGDDG